ncbi:MAG: GIY-YIG nuclease family protein [Hyphomonadaceae bacterium]|nr:MAG: putative endonuclease [Caulobacteraceae bacterium]MBT9447421.1 GIY-YIG nuclease family protein [Hyphomonadaceae bacterium]TPW07489.1 MAG: putative endonuclease [Alphaproteobacteria bacterium]
MNSERAIAVYILASRRNGTLYTGVTSDLPRRVFEHRIGKGSPFTRKYGVTKLVWFEAHDWLDGARLREKRIKEWRRAWKVKLIEARNPDWIDLYASLNGGLAAETRPCQSPLGAARGRR